MVIARLPRLSVPEDAVLASRLLGAGPCHAHRLELVCCVKRSSRDLATDVGVVRVQAGLVLTILFVPNLMSLDLREGDRRFDALMAGNPAAYSGDAVHPRNLSLFERMLGVQK